MKFYLHSSRKPRRTSAPREVDGTQEMEEKSIWVRTQDKLWYKLSLSKSPPKIRRSRSTRACLKSPLPEVANRVHLGASSVISGSTFYILGGFGRFNARSREVHYLDHQPGKQPLAWKMGPPMISPRADPACVDLDGKIYVFGGLQEEHFTPFAEVFDPKANAWKPLAPPPRNRKYYCLTDTPPNAAASTDSQNRPIILVHFGYRGPVLLAYRVYNDTWTCLDSKFGCGLSCFNVVDNVLYCLRYHHDPETVDILAAYDLRHNRWLSFDCPVETSEAELSLVHLGGDRLCFVGFARIEIDVFGLFCFSFSVEKIMQGGTLCSIAATGMTFREFYVRANNLLSFHSTSTV